MGNVYRVGLNLGTLCNLKCKYCYEHDHQPTSVPTEYLDRYAEYLLYLVSTLPEGSKLDVGIYGGEPLLHIDRIERFIRQTQSCVRKYIIVINGTLVDSCKEQLLRLAQYNKIRNTIVIRVSYDFTLQDSMRCAGTYDTVRDAIRWLYNQGLCMGVTPVFTFATIHHFKEVFLDFVELRKELPRLHMLFNIDKNAEKVPDDFDEQGLREQLAFVRDCLAANPELEGSIEYNKAIWNKRWEPADTGAFYRNLIGAMVDDGTMYPAWCMPYYHEVAQKLLRFGHITDDFDTLITNRHALIAKLPKMSVPSTCTDCALNCRLNPFQAITESLDQWNTKPRFEGTCYLTKLINEYLPID